MATDSCCCMASICTQMVSRDRGEKVLLLEMYFLFESKRKEGIGSCAKDAFELVSCAS